MKIKEKLETIFVFISRIPRSLNKIYLVLLGLMLFLIYLNFYSRSLSHEEATLSTLDFQKSIFVSILKELLFPGIPIILLAILYTYYRHRNKHKIDLEKEKERERKMYIFFYIFVAFVFLYFIIMTLINRLR